MKIHFPSYNEYQAVLQSPAYCFAIPELKSSTIETDLWGLPRVRSGGFALTYKLTSRTRSLAVRCFHRNVPDRTLRYAAISAFLSYNPSDVLLPTHYLTNGILVRGSWYPITYMKWVEGDTLEAYIVKNFQNSERMDRLNAEFLHLVSELEKLHVSHGDLSHRNIIIGSQQKMILVDYDGMFVPGMEGRKSCEVGNIHFQIPGRREEHFTDSIDRFSEIVIYLAVAALSKNPALWLRYETGGEGLLFQREDFVNPYQSKLLQDIEILADLRPLVTQFRRICTSPINQIPRLVDFIQGKPLEFIRSEVNILPSAQPSVQDATLRIGLLSKVGSMVTVVGKISEIFRGVSTNDEPHIFLNFGNWKAKCFTVVLWKESLQLLDVSGKNPNEYMDRWVSVKGIMTAYERRPQIVIESPTDIQFLQSEEEARQLIKQSRTMVLGAGKRLPSESKPLPVKEFGSANLPYPQPAPLKSSFQKASGSLDQTQMVISRLEKLYADLQKLKKPNTDQ